MRRKANVPKKNKKAVDYRGSEYIPVIKKRKKKSKVKKPEKYFKTILFTEKSKEFYIGELLIGSTNNIFPVQFNTVNICFKLTDELDSDSCDTIVLHCDNVSVVVRNCIYAEYIRELITHKDVFSFDFKCKDEKIYLKLYFTVLPLPKFSSRLGNCLKTIFLLFYEVTFFTDDKSLGTSFHKFHKSEEIKKLYEKLAENRKSMQCATKEKEQNVQHSKLKPTLRSYQEKSVKWMLCREQTEDVNIDQLHPLYTPLKLYSGLEVYLDKYSGYVSLQKPIVLLQSKGGILADEMGLGKTVEVLCCILLNPRNVTREINEIKEDFEQDSDNNDLSHIKKTQNKICIEDSNEELNTNNSLIVKRKIIDELEESDSPLVQYQKKKPKLIIEKTEYTNQSTKIKVPDDGVKNKSKKSSTYLALDMWYKSVLSEISTIRPKCKKNSTSKSIQCICGSISEEGIIKCLNCNKYQHVQCLGYKEHLGKYLCPKCWMEEPLLESGATLIVTPTALKTQWSKEICRHIKGNFKVLHYDGSNATPIYPTELKDFDVVLTTYSVLQNELRLTECGQVFNLRSERKYSTPGSPLIRIKWWRLCLDEAQAVETPGRMVSEMAKKIDAVYRWAVTGTPISKSILDLYGLIDYLQISPYNDLTTWNKILYEPYINGNEEPLVNFLSRVLWRTAKKDVTDQINIPKQTYLKHMLEFSAVEKYFYNREHELICNDFLCKVTNYDLSMHLESLDKSLLKKLMAPLLILRHACTHPNTVRGRYLATKKQVTSMKELLNALILKNTNDSEDCLRLIISAFNGLAGIYLLQNNPNEAINNYRHVLQLTARFSGEKGETKLTVDKPQVIHTLYNLAEIIDISPPEDRTLRDASLRKECEELEKQYMEKFINESTASFKTFSALMHNVQTLQNSFLLKDGQWYSDGLDWVLINDHFDELLTKIQTACDNSNVQNNLRNASERILLQSMYLWDDDITNLRIKLFDAVENLYNYQPESVHKIVIKEHLVAKAMNCHLRPQKKGKKAAKCPVCIANDHLKQYEEKLFDMAKRVKTFEDMSLIGSWKPTLQELVLKTLVTLLRAKNSKKEYIKDGENHITIIENLKKEFKELRKLWTLLDQQICASDELDICKVRLQLKTDIEEKKSNRALKNLIVCVENKQETINLLSIHELDYQMSLLENDVRQNTAKLEKLLGTQSYLETLRKQQYEGQSPDPCPICKNSLEQHWSILSCGHSYCLECIQVLFEQTVGDQIQCSICRNKQKCQDISYIKAGLTVSDDDCKQIKGNYSTKIEAIIKVLLDLQRENADVKVLVFSSWVTVLKCLKEALNTNSITCDLANAGTLDAKITNFKDPSKTVTVLLLPINLGSKGLNLIEATHVILVEPLLNPADELQAIGRINRIGQTKATFVHKFLIKNTIEENIHQATTSNAENWEKSSVTLRHLVDLFNTAEIHEEPNDPQPLETSPSVETSESNIEGSIHNTSEALGINAIEINDSNKLIQSVASTSTDDLPTSSFVNSL